MQTDLLLFTFVREIYILVESDYTAFTVVN